MRGLRILLLVVPLSLPFALAASAQSGVMLQRSAQLSFSGAAPVPPPAMAPAPVAPAPERDRAVSVGAMPVMPPSLPLVAPLSEGPAMSAGGSMGGTGGEGVAYSPVLLELYTSQGCAACPPADEMLASIASRDDVIALALHVDYWDYIGWVDRFALPDHAERQRRYARRHGHSTIYTPQVVIDGVDIMEGFRVVQVMEAIESHRVRPRPVALEIERSESGELHIRARRVGPQGNEAGQGDYLAARSASSGGAGGAMLAGAAALGQAREAQPYSVELVRYQRHAEVDITAGENAGRRAGYVNIVTSWDQVGQWDLAGPLELSVPVEGDAPIVVLIQEPGLGAVVAAQRLR